MGGEHILTNFYLAFAFCLCRHLLQPTKWHCKWQFVVLHTPTLIIITFGICFKCLCHNILRLWMQWYLIKDMDHKHNTCLLLYKYVFIAPKHRSWPKLYYIIFFLTLTLSWPLLSNVFQFVYEIHHFGHFFQMCSNLYMMKSTILIYFSII